MVVMLVVTTYAPTDLPPNSHWVRCDIRYSLSKHAHKAARDDEEGTAYTSKIDINIEDCGLPDETEHRLQVPGKGKPQSHKEC